MDVHPPKYSKIGFDTSPIVFNILHNSAISNYFHAALGPNKPNKPIESYWMGNKPGLMAEYGWVPHIRRLSPSTHAKDKFTLPGHLSHASRTGRTNMSQRFGTGLSVYPQLRGPSDGVPKCSKVHQIAPDCTIQQIWQIRNSTEFNRIQQNSSIQWFAISIEDYRRLSKIIEDYRRLSKI